MGELIVHMVGVCSSKVFPIEEIPRQKVNFNNIKNYTDTERAAKNGSVRKDKNSQFYKFASLILLIL